MPVATPRTLRLALAGLTLLAATVGVAACGDDDEAVGSGGPGTTQPGADGPNAEEPVADRFADVTWELLGGTVDGTDLVLVEGSPVTLSVADGEVGGRAACNTYGGALTITGEEVAVGPLRSTMMACLDDGVMELEAAFLGGLERVTAVALDDEILVLTGEGVELRFAAQPEIPDADLAGTDWQLESLLLGDAVSSTIAGAEGNLLIGEDGELSGSTGCNLLIGSVEVVDGRLEGAVGNTERACEPDVMEQEAHVLAVLTGSPTVTIEGDVLTLLLADGRGLGYRAAS
jgi:heat shock protein HslJ